MSEQAQFTSLNDGVTPVTFSDKKYTEIPEERYLACGISPKYIREKKYTHGVSLPEDWRIAANKKCNGKGWVRELDWMVHGKSTRLEDLGHYIAATLLEKGNATLCIPFHRLLHELMEDISFYKELLDVRVLIITDFEVNNEGGIRESYGVRPLRLLETLIRQRRGNRRSTGLHTCCDIFTSNNAVSIWSKQFVGMVFSPEFTMVRVDAGNE